MNNSIQKYQYTTEYKKISSMNYIVQKNQLTTVYKNINTLQCSKTSTQYSTAQFESTVQFALFSSWVQFSLHCAVLSRVQFALFSSWVQFNLHCSVLGTVHCQYVKLSGTQKGGRKCNQTWKAESAQRKKKTNLVFPAYNMAFLAVA